MSEPLTIARTGRGFAIAEFKDLYGEPCSIQDSSLAQIDAIWLGTGDNRMHLSIEQVEVLIPLLERFVVSGTIGEEE